MKKIILSILIFIGSITNADVFDKGRSSVGVVAGSGYSHGESYTIIGIGVDYFIKNGLSIGVGYRGWFGGSPDMNQLTIASTYYIPLSEKFHPYIGGFVRETFVDYDKLEDENYVSYGARGGLAMTMSPNSYISFGYVYEEYGNCTESAFRDCSNSYPEFVFSLAF